MQPRRYKPLVDKLFWWIAVPSVAFMVFMTVFVCLMPAPFAAVIVALCTVLILYFMITPLFGYVELREECVFIKCGFFMKREIPYDRIRTTEKARRWYSDSMVSLKCAMEHVNIKYNRFDIFSVSVVGNDELMDEINARAAAAKVK